MDREELLSLGRALARARTERGLSQLRLAGAAGLAPTRVGHLERGTYPRPKGGQWRPAVIDPDELAAIAAALDTTPAAIADRADLTPATRERLGLPPLSRSQTIVDGRTWDLTAAEAARVADFIRGLIAAREL